MAHLAATDPDGNPIPLVDFTGQTINFAQNVGPDSASMVWQLIDRLVQNGVLVQADLAEILNNQFQTPGDYQISVVE